MEPVQKQHKGRKNFATLSQRRRREIASEAKKELIQQLNYKSQVRRLAENNDSCASSSTANCASSFNISENVEEVQSIDNCNYHDIACEEDSQDKSASASIDKDEVLSIPLPQVSEYFNIEEEADDIPELSLKCELRNLFQKSNITMQCMTQLLGILRRHGHKDELPADARTLLGTPKYATDGIKSINGGSYFHFGVEEGILHSMKKYLKICPDSISVKVNCDGLSLSKSSASAFWPISLMLDIPQKVEPFLVGVHHGNGKPDDANIFLKPFVEEMKVLQQHGLIFLNKNCHVHISKIICDSPARAFITKTIGHAGYESCSKCIQRGEFSTHVILNNTLSDLRTDESFRLRTHPGHHTGDSILEELNIGMVSQIALDYMHMVCLGVTKRLLSLWVKGTRDVKLDDKTRDTVSEYLIKYKAHIPAEFSRLPRALKDYMNWKATEFRLFLLYLGPIVMQPAIQNANYINFIELSLGIRILCDPETCIEKNDVAKKLLIEFVNEYPKLYGAGRLTYNTHNLIHIADDVLAFKCSLDGFSCFPFENYFRSIQGKLQNSPKPLQQLVNRLAEEKLMEATMDANDQLYPNIQYGRTNLVKIQFKDFLITNRAPNNLCIDSDHKLLLIQHIYDLDKIVCLVITDTKPLFIVPCDSRDFDICLYDSNANKGNTFTIPAKKIKKKCLNLPYFINNFFVSMPIIHSNN